LLTSGYELNAFLPFSEIGNNEYISKEQIGDNNGKNKHYKKLSNIEVDLETNQEIYVQVIKEPFAGKGPRVTSRYSNSWEIIGVNSKP